MKPPSRELLAKMSIEEKDFFYLAQRLCFDSPEGEIEWRSNEARNISFGLSHRVEADYVRKVLQSRRQVLLRVEKLGLIKWQYSPILGGLADKTLVSMAPEYAKESKW